jgi:hypothetical protein
MRLKKALGVLGIVGALSASPSMPALAESPGDMMPSDLGNYKNQQPYRSPKGVIVRKHYHNENDKCLYNTFHLMCDGQVNEKPFAVLRFSTGEILVDNPTDGVIDNVYNMKNNPPPLSSQIPDCTTGKESLRI